MPARRHMARITVMQTLFEHETRPQLPLDEVLARNIEEAKHEHSVDSEFARGLLGGIVERNEDICHALQQCAPQWPLERMDRISRVILIIGGYELLYGNDAPPPVIMNEAIEIAKEYGTEESGKFVNGVLNALAHRKSDK